MLIMLSSQSDGKLLESEYSLRSLGLRFSPESSNVATIVAVDTRSSSGTVAAKDAPFGNWCVSFFFDDGEDFWITDISDEKILRRNFLPCCKVSEVMLMPFSSLEYNIRI